MIGAFLAAMMLLVAGCGGESHAPELRPLLEADDVVIDGGNSYYRDDITRAKDLKRDGIHYVDVGTSGGVWGLDRAAFAKSPGLDDFSGRVSDSGEGRWTVLAAVDEGVPASVIAASLYERFESRDMGAFTGKILSAMRSEFGGHAEKKA
jgi:6-phosphogluconate dehydrogenase (decarboxylating)